MSSKYIMTITSADSGATYHDGADVGRAPVVAAHNIETCISVLVGYHSVDVHRIEPVYDAPDGGITGWMEVGESVRLWRELVALRDRVDMHETATTGTETFSVVTRGENYRLLIVEVSWYANVG